MRYFTQFFLITLSLIVTNCARDLSSDTYTESATAGKVLEGTLLSARPVKIKASDKLRDNTAGALGGGVLGAAGGSAIGRGTGSLLGAVGGAIVGAVAGAATEQALSNSSGMEYIVKLDKKYIQAAAEYRKKITASKNSSVDNDLKSGIQTDTQTDIISVIQAADNKAVLDPGARVYVIFNNDRPRVIPAAPVPAH